jgi:hypothetical protein
LSFLALLLVDADPPGQTGHAEVQLLADEIGGEALLELELHGIQPDLEGIVSSAPFSFGPPFVAASFVSFSRALPGLLLFSSAFSATLIMLNHLKEGHPFFVIFESQ